MKGVRGSSLSKSEWYDYEPERAESISKGPEAGKDKAHFKNREKVIKTEGWV